ncbi:MAG: HAMP domain-containing histidine kinase [Ruminococcaceae bacterium]|nr:HAMP domain-containing histidine kinase [Oscillospiraceae bacterium]
MKKFLYSNYTKTIAVLLFIVSIVLGALTVTNGIAEYCNERELIYGFESDFNEARHFETLLVAPEGAVFNAVHDLYNQFDEEVIQALEKGFSIVDPGSYEGVIREWLDDMYCADKINYYVKWNNKVFTNCGATSEKELMTAQFYRLTKRDENGNIDRVSSQNRYYSYPFFDELSLYDMTPSIVICTSVKEAYVNECKVVWDRQATVVHDTFKIALICVIAALLLLIYLLCVCGKNKDGEHKSMWLDNIWTEVHLAAIGGLGFGAVVICVILLDDYFTGHFPYNLMNMVVGLVAAIASAVVITSTLSIIRNIKCKRFVESSIIVRVIRWCFKIFVKVLVWLRNGFVECRNLVFRTLSKKTGIILISMLFVYTALMGMCGFLGYHEALFIVFGVLLFFFAAFVVAYRAKDLDEVKKGVSEVRNGNVAYKIPELKSEDMKVLATNINDIAKGLDESVSAKVKAERMKTELITNVSHDLKTPLTSIISYTELLANVEGLPEEAKDYAQIIANKSDRLKTLTQDLFDISKVQSGNESVVLEKLDVSLLINQSLGEHDNEIKESELPFCVNAPKELYISADGRKMSRVVSNLINNMLKYSMKNTRVFIIASEKDGEVVMEFKNIASYPMNFSADEIVGRFVRGDESRTQEGNGLGLAIAKSYTEICNGKFEIVLDGDMFKAILKFRKYS